MYCDIGIIGLSVMGSNLALNMADHGFQVAGFNRSRAVTEKLLETNPHRNLHLYYELEDFVAALKRPRRIMLMVKAGEAVDTVIQQMLPLLEQGDIILDGGNSYFEDTRRRSQMLQEKGLIYFGVGVSGGAEGARHGPSVMPGGSKENYAAIQPILTAVAAKADGEPCCTYIGPDGAGHYVKMVHNGIEYADMQLIAESYLLLKHVAGFSNAELAQLFAQWNQGELKSFLIQITAEIFREPDDFTPGELVDYILDSAAQKGTGRWTSIQALRQGVDTSMITAAASARVMSNEVETRKAAENLLQMPPVAPVANQAAFAEKVREALYCAKIMAYAQGFALMKNASQTYDWNLDLGAIASIFRAGCIIQADFLGEISGAFRREPDLSNLLLNSFFQERIAKNHQSLRSAVAAGIQAGLPLPAMSNALAYLDAFRGNHVGANLIQAQRDLFGAHTYERIDRPGTFHHLWRQEQ